MRDCDDHRRSAGRSKTKRTKQDQAPPTHTNAPASTDAGDGQGPEAAADIDRLADAIARLPASERVTLIARAAMTIPAGKRAALRALLDDHDDELPRCSDAR